MDIMDIAIAKNLAGEGGSSGGAEPTMILFRIDEELGDTYFGGMTLEKAWSLVMAGYPVFAVNVQSSDWYGANVYQLSRIEKGDDYVSMLFVSNQGDSVTIDSFSDYDPDLHL